MALIPSNQPMSSNAADLISLCIFLAFHLVSSSTLLKLSLQLYFHTVLFYFKVLKHHIVFLKASLK